MREMKPRLKVIYGKGKWKVLQALKAKGGAATEPVVIAGASGVSIGQVRRCLRQLVEYGLVEECYWSPGRKRYGITSKGEDFFDRLNYKVHARKAEK